jgi:hypothetical protein
VITTGESAPESAESPAGGDVGKIVVDVVDAEVDQARATDPGTARPGSGLWITA